MIPHWMGAMMLLAFALQPGRAIAQASPNARENPASSAVLRQNLRIDDLMHALAQVQESRATFVEEKSIAALQAPLRNTGRLLYRRPSYLEKVTTEPRQERLVVEGDRLVITEGDNQAPRVVDLSSHPEISALVDAIRETLAGDLPKLQRNYRVALDGTADTWRLTLTPASQAVGRFLRNVEIRGSNATLREVRFTQANGDSSRMIIEPAH